tara:strand:- start:240 stop:563 length:324 start_codon:yes stop_codon:yes gene_type:complete
LKKNVPNPTGKGGFVKGQSGNPHGRPKKGHAIVDKFRDNPKANDVLKKIFDIANSLGTKKEHEDAFSCAKLIADKLVPTLKSEDLTIDAEVNTGYVVLPEEKEADSE